MSAIPITAAPYGLTSEATEAFVSVGADDLQGPGMVFCPNPKMTLWNAHPRVFIDVAGTGQGKCPYCSTLYRLTPDALAAAGGHGH